MSVVERALRKLQGTVPASATRDESPIARTVTARTLNPKGESSSAMQFHAASGRAIDFDLDALATAGLLAPGNERLADEYRGIKRPVLRKAAAHEASVESFVGIDRLVMVASALPGEGKTFTSVNLSLSIARERDWSVLLVDADCRNPSLSRLLGVAGEPGLLDYLKDPSKGMESFVLPTNIERLYILPRGSSDEHAAELLASERMHTACTALAAGEFGNFVVIFDSSPLLLTPEPVIISGHIGQVILVIQSGQTSRPAVADAIGRLDDNKAIGLVLNKAAARDLVSSYSYGYSYSSYGKPSEAPSQSEQEL